MKNVLYVTANPKKVDDSISLSVGERFIEEYQKQNPNDRLTRIDLNLDYVQDIDRDVIYGWEQLRNGKKLEDLSHASKEKISLLDMMCDQFIAADRIVLAYPLWNLGMPAVVKRYIDAVCLIGKTFKYTENGPVGLLTDRKQKVMQIVASGGYLIDSPFDFAKKYIDSVMQFMGVVDVQTLSIQGMSERPDLANNIIETAMAKAISKAKIF